MQTDIFEMGAADGRSGGANKLPRTQTVSVRLDPKLRYLSEIAARRQRRTISSFIEWALETTLDNLHLTDAQGNTTSIGYAASKLWDVEPADRFAKLALRYPDLLNHHEEIVWKLIQENGYLWHGSRSVVTGEWKWKPTEEDDLIFQRLRDQWETFNAVARGDLPKSDLPKWDRFRPPAPKKDGDAK